MIRVWIGLGLLWGLCVSALAHEVRPALLQITETADSKYAVLWKQPVLSGRRLKLTPTFPPDCDRGAGETILSNHTILEISTLGCDLESGFIAIEGLERTLTDVFVEINHLSGETRRALLKPDAPRLNLSTRSDNAVRDYLIMGVEHILMGWDHVLFVIGLCLLVTRRQIWGVATSFTLAHSLTLAAAAFGVLNVPSRPVEILIALSIVMLGVEVMRKINGETGLAVRRPYLISFAIGLIHGCGFATALADIGLPKGAELFALLLFNAGIELGQFAVIAGIMLSLWLISNISLTKEKQARILMTYIMAGIAMFWVIDRMKDYWV